MLVVYYFLAAASRIGFKFDSISLQTQMEKVTLMQAELLEFKLAWLDADEARERLIDFVEKLKQGQKLLLQREQELQESQAPVKCAPNFPCALQCQAAGTS